MPAGIAHLLVGIVRVPAATSSATPMLTSSVPCGVTYPKAMGLHVPFRDTQRGEWRLAGNLGFFHMV